MIKSNTFSIEELQKTLLCAVFDAQNSSFMLNALHSIDPYHKIFVKNGMCHRFRYTDIMSWCYENKISTAPAELNDAGMSFYIVHNGETLTNESYASEDDAKMAAFEICYPFPDPHKAESK